MILLDMLFLQSAEYRYLFTVKKEESAKYKKPNRFYWALLLEQVNNKHFKNVVSILAQKPVPLSDKGKQVPKSHNTCERA